MQNSSFHHWQFRFYRCFLHHFVEFELFCFFVHLLCICLLKDSPLLLLISSVLLMCSSLLLTQMLPWLDVLELLLIKAPFFCSLTVALWSRWYSIRSKAAGLSSILILLFSWPSENIHVTMRSGFFSYCSHAFSICNFTVFILCHFVATLLIQPFDWRLVLSIFLKARFSFLVFFLSAVSASHPWYRSIEMVYSFPCFLCKISCQCSFLIPRMLAEVWRAPLVKFVSVYFSASLPEFPSQWQWSLLVFFSFHEVFLSFVQSSSSYVFTSFPVLYFETCKINIIFFL